MILPYRARRVLKQILITVLVLALIATAVWLCWLLWLQRYVRYTQNGAILDFNQPLEYPQNQVSAPADPLPTVNIQYGGTEDPGQTQTELMRFSGYYVTLDTLLSDFDNVTQQLRQLPMGSTVLLDVKSVSSYSYFSTGVGMRAPDFDTAKLDTLINELRQGGHYLIARIPAFQEYRYILADERSRVPDGLPKSGGNGSLWLDGDGPCYWMNPAKDGTMSYLIQTVTELRQLGFSEVVLDDFRFPNTDKISFSGDRQQTLIDAAEKLVNTCATDTFCVSFVRSKPDLNLPEGHSRIYLEDVSVLDTLSLAEQSGFEDPSVRLVFLTDSGDTRFDEYCVLRPLDMAGA